MYKKIRGTKDLFNDNEIMFSFVERLLIDIALIYNCSRIRTPVFENSELFKRSTGENSEIIQKQMYEFHDKKGRTLALKPEGTAPIIRAFVENKLYSESDNVKLFYLDKMYRYERPQKGRQREFYQFGVEYIFDKSIFIDAELIQMAITILDALKIKEYKLMINSLGSFDTQRKYSEKLIKFFNDNINFLGEDAKKRIKTNPLKILDSKIEMSKAYFKDIPSIKEFYSEEDKKYLNDFLHVLDLFDIKYVVNEKLVRGLDYYSDIVFEFISTKFNNSQNTLIGGGRYSNLVSKLDGPDISGVGFAIGLERLIENIVDEELIKDILDHEIDVYVANLSLNTRLISFMIIQLLRNAAFKTEGNYKVSKLTKLFRISEKYKPKFIIICGPKEISKNKIIIKNQKDNTEKIIDIDNIIEYLSKYKD